VSFADILVVIRDISPHGLNARVVSQGVLLVVVTVWFSQGHVWRIPHGATNTPHRRYAPIAASATGFKSWHDGWLAIELIARYTHFTRSTNLRKSTCEQLLLAVI
jgi:hypothetical protein